MFIDQEAVIQWARDAGLPTQHAKSISDVLGYVAQRAAEAEQARLVKIARRHFLELRDIAGDDLVAKLSACGTTGEKQG